MRHKSLWLWMSTISFELFMIEITISSESLRLTSFCKLHRLFFNELANATKTTPLLIINPSPNCNCLASFGLSLISSWLKISQVIEFTFRAGYFTSCSGRQ